MPSMPRTLNWTAIMHSYSWERKCYDAYFLTYIKIHEDINIIFKHEPNIHNIHAIKVDMFIIFKHKSNKLVSSTQT
jgi:hypothetical protein